MRTKPEQLQAKPLTILQVNVGKGAISHEIALSLASDSRIDIILIQEPLSFHISREELPNPTLSMSYLPL